jgi:ABC-type oligopeptide transport system substrate-binding subunit
MIRERRFAAATLALALALTTACAPDPAPTPSPTGFASQEEAFAAAEATYRAYVDALNAVDLADPAP